MTKYQIDHFDATPKYYQLIKILTDKIEQQVWDPYKAIPSERDLSIEYNVARSTIRQAIEYLCATGYLYKMHGKGTFVSPKKIVDFQKISIMGYKERTINMGMTPSQKILDMKEVPLTSELMEKMDLQDQSHKVYKLDRLFYSDEQIDSLNVSYLNLPSGQTITRDELIEYGSLYSLMQDRFNYVPYLNCQTIKAEMPSEEIVSILGLGKDKPILYIESVVWNQNRHVMEYVNIYKQCDLSPHYSFVSK